MNISFLSIESWESWDHRKINEPLSSRFEIACVLVKERVHALKYAGAFNQRGILL